MTISLLIVQLIYDELHTNPSSCIHPSVFNSVPKITKVKLFNITYIYYSIIIIIIILNIVSFELILAKCQEYEAERYEAQLLGRLHCYIREIICETGVGGTALNSFYLGMR